MPKFIKWAKAKKASQPIYEHAPQSHQAKAGTPTMGGIVFIIATIIATLLTAKLSNIYVVGGLLTLILFSFISSTASSIESVTRKSSISESEIVPISFII